MNSTSKKDAELLRACAKGAEEDVLELLGAGADLNAKDAKGRTPLMFASLRDRCNIVKILLGKGADANATGDKGETALLLACLGGHARIARELVKKGADVNSRTRRGSTPLMAASRIGSLDTVQLLLENGARIRFKDSRGRTALERARDAGRDEICGLLFNKNREPLLIVGNALLFILGGLVGIGWIYDFLAPEPGKAYMEQAVPKMTDVLRPVPESYSKDNLRGRVMPPVRVYPDRHGGRLLLGPKGPEYLLPGEPPGD